MCSDYGRLPLRGCCSSERRLDCGTCIAAVTSRRECRARAPHRQARQSTRAAHSRPVHVRCVAALPVPRSIVNIGASGGPMRCTSVVSSQTGRRRSFQ